VTGSGQELGGSFALGPWRVRRAGYGAMQLAGDGVFGPPRDRDEALRVLRAARGPAPAPTSPRTSAPPTSGSTTRPAPS